MRLHIGSHPGITMDELTKMFGDRKLSIFDISNELNTILTNYEKQRYSNYPYLYTFMILT